MHYVGAILKAESIQITQPLRIGFSIMSLTKRANSADLPRQEGKGCVDAKRILGNLMKHDYFVIVTAIPS